MFGMSQLDPQIQSVITLSFIYINYMCTVQDLSIKNIS